MAFNPQSAASRHYNPQELRQVAEFTPNGKSTIFTLNEVLIGGRIPGFTPFIALPAPEVQEMDQVLRGLIGVLGASTGKIPNGPPSAITLVTVGTNINKLEEGIFFEQPF